MSTLFLSSLVEADCLFASLTWPKELPKLSIHQGAISTKTAQYDAKTAQDLTESIMVGVQVHSSFGATAL